MKNHIRVILSLPISLLLINSSVFALPTTIKSYDGHYLWANNGGGGILQFTSFGGATWETFTIENQTSGRVAIKCYDNTHYVWASNGGGGLVDATSGGGDTWQTFTMVDLGAGKYAFRCYDGTHYLSATNGGGSTITASATSIGNYETFEWSGYVPQNRANAFGARIGNETFIWSTYTPGESVTVGHNGSGADFICDGTNDEQEINQALATKKIVKLIADSPYNINNSIVIPGKDIIYTLIANTPSNPPVLKAGIDNSKIIYAPNAAFNISYLKFDGNGKSTHCVECTSSVAGSEISYNFMYGFSTKGSSFMGCGIYGTNQNIVSIHHNTISNAYGVPIWLEGKTDPANRGVYANIYYNQILNSVNYGVTAAIQGEHMHIYNNNIVSYGFKSNTWAGGSGDGISVSRSKVEYNVVRGCGGAGIKPTYYPMAADGTTDDTQYYPAFANDAYNFVDHNIFEYNGSNGIDYWYSDSSIISNNRCNDNGQNDDPMCMDRSGIDVCNHSQKTIVNNNECTNKASTKVDTVKSKGTNYVEAKDISRWYDNRNGANVPFDGMYISIGSSTNRIDHIDISTGRLYLYWTLDGSVSVGAKIQGINKQLIGINVGDNAQSLGYHYGSGNNVYGNTWNIEPTIDGSHLPNTVITSDGTGPIPALK